MAMQWPIGHPNLLYDKKEFICSIWEYSSTGAAKKSIQLWQKWTSKFVWEQQQQNLAAMMMFFTLNLLIEQHIFLVCIWNRADDENEVCIWQVQITQLLCVVKLHATSHSSIYMQPCTCISKHTCIGICADVRYKDETWHRTHSGINFHLRRMDTYERRGEKNSFKIIIDTFYAIRKLWKNQKYIKTTEKQTYR